MHLKWSFECMSDEISFPLTVEMESTIAITQACLKQMKKCCEMEIPFHVASEMGSAIDVTQDCLKQIQKCCELAKKLASLKSYKKEGNLTKVMLILTPYGSENKFKDFFVNAITTFGDRLERLRDYVEGIEAMVDEKSYKCTQCQGTGTLFKWVYVRERGTPTQRIFRSFRCDACGGKGCVSITIDVQTSLNAFLEKANEVFIAMRKYNKSLNDFASIYCAQFKERQEPPRKPTDV